MYVRFQVGSIESVNSIIVNNTKWQVSKVVLVISEKPECSGHGKPVSPKMQGRMASVIASVTLESKLVSAFASTC